MLEDTFEMDDQDELEEEAEAEVEKVLWELTAGKSNHNPTTTPPLSPNFPYNY